MIIDVAFLIILTLFFLLGYKKGFIFEFFGIFITLLSFYLSNMLYPFVSAFFTEDKGTYLDNAKIFAGITVAIFVILFIVLNLFKRFLKLIKLKRLDNILGGFLGLVKGSFLVFIVFIILLLVSKTDQKLRTTMKESISVNIISTYLYSYSDLFPEFIKDTLTEYKQNNDEKKFRNDILKELENNDEKPKVENENNR
ncbi:Colicin V production protein [Sebaldella termitidis]|jgi:membrane protein required for colicin V production|uniref:Colicin V production protein n=1 Tax=Sebaldella termitidis (strain ATCC 33386 / NCTC 11300) TaxID=526218 RepID=D1AMK6_SEBTE|nr:CvpA family protein [Sebaldella termitidis]ACZ09580.1 Colicin V production protein [Sebaldella termitidis ATCC 33386]SUI24910.1 Colicin V production protein [Sebaldella termitidis]